MPAKWFSVFLVVVMIGFTGILAAEASDRGSAPPESVAPLQFSWESLAEPESLFWPGYFWFWNAPMDTDAICRQLRDMAAHDARSACAVPLPHEFRAEELNSGFDVDYLSPEFFDRVKIIVDEAARLKMNYWLYDEGGWPSGQAAGRVVKERPDLQARVLARTDDGQWTLDHNGGPDLLNPQATDTFLALTHQRYADAVGEHFGKTIQFTFTDEPCYRRVDPGRLVPWPEGAEEMFQREFGYNPLAKLDAFHVMKPQDLSQEQKKLRVDMFDFWSWQFRDAYFLPLRDWAHRHGLASAGHLDCEDDLIQAVRRGGYGHVMRPLRAMDVPGVDAIWRQLLPGGRNHHFPKFASSAAHQNGTALAVSESFCVYGQDLTPAQMKWVVDYQYVRGINLLVIGAYHLSTRDHMMADQRPHFGPVNPLWDFLPDFHRYAARLGYVLACGQPDIEVGLYYPIRDIWASGDPDDPALRGHNALARALAQRQCDFDVVDDDVFTDPSTQLEGGRVVCGKMKYRTIVVGPTQWMTDAARQQLEAFKAAGGQLIHIDDLDHIDAALADIVPTAKCEPACSGLRVSLRRWPGGGAMFVFNEGNDDYRGLITFDLDGKLHEVEPATGAIRAVEIADSSDIDSSGNRQPVPLNLMVGESRLLIASANVHANLAATVSFENSGQEQSIELADGWTASVERQYVVGEHDFEIHPFANAEFQPATLGRWATSLRLGEDFSGHVTYRRTVSVPDSWHGKRLFLTLGGLEYAARVSVDGRPVGCVLWSPWRIELPPPMDHDEFVLDIEVSNTLANELTSQRVRDAWTKRIGPGWPGLYHARALEFEQKARGGGLLGPVSLNCSPTAANPFAEGPRRRAGQRSPKSRGMF